MPSRARTTSPLERLSSCLPSLPRTSGSSTRSPTAAILGAASDGTSWVQVQPRVMTRRKRRTPEAGSAEMEARARLIQQSWRRQQAEMVIAGVRRGAVQEDSSDAVRMLAHLAQSAPQNRSLVPRSSLPGAGMQAPSTDAALGSPSALEEGRRGTTCSRYGGADASAADQSTAPPPTPAASFAEVADKAEAPSAMTALKLPPPPEVGEAQAYASSLVLRQVESDEHPGELYPLYTSLRSFDRFGTDLSQYMHFMYWTARLYFALFMLNLSNLVINWEGRQLVSPGGQFDVIGVLPGALTWHTLGNAAVSGVLSQGAHSYGVIEFFTSGAPPAEDDRRRAGGGGSAAHAH